jgi:hypothetical protein
LAILEDAAARLSHWDGVKSRTVVGSPLISGVPPISLIKFESEMGVRSASETEANWFWMDTGSAE